MLTCGRCGKAAVVHVPSQWDESGYADGFLRCEACGLKAMLHPVNLTGLAGPRDTVSTTPGRAAPTPPRPTRAREPASAKPGSEFGALKAVVGIAACAGLLAGALALSHNLRPPSLGHNNYGNLAPPKKCAPYQMVPLTDGPPGPGTTWICSYLPYPPDGVNSKPCLPQPALAKHYYDRREDREREGKKRQEFEFKQMAPEPDSCGDTVTEPQRS